MSLSLAVASSCSSDAGDDTDAAVLASCGNMAAAQCNYAAACMPAVLSTEYADAETCKSRVRLNCVGITKRPGSSWNAARLDQCTEYLNRGTCDAWNFTGSPCANTPGTLPDGARCFDSSQCASAFCKLVATGEELPACGTCTPSGCTPTSCGANQVCLPSTAGGQCIDVLSEGEACTPTSLCSSGLSCIESVCAKQRSDGEPCSSLTDCNYPQGLACIDRVCRQPATAQPGEACGDAARCTAGAQCKLVPPSTSLTCVAPLADGSPCTASGASCRSPARCLGGKCTLPADLSCP